MINSLKNLSEDVFKVPSISLHTCSQPFSNPQNCSINGVLGETVPYFLQHNFEFSFSGWLWPVLLIGSKHHTPDAKIHRIKIWGVWRPFILSDEIRTNTKDKHKREAFREFQKQIYPHPVTKICNRKYCVKTLRERSFQFKRHYITLRYIIL